MKRSGFKPKAKPAPGLLRTANLGDSALKLQPKPTVTVKLKPRACAVCKHMFIKLKAMQVVCGPVSAAKHAEQQRTKRERKAARADHAADRAKKEAMKSRSQLLKEAQASFNAFIRERDANEPCISCGRFHKGAYDAGHYRSVGAMPTLRFNEDNVHKQCVPCNQHKGGNVLEYRLRLLGKIGTDRVAFLEGPHEPAKLTSDDARTIKRIYQLKLKDLRAARAEQEAA